MIINDRAPSEMTSEERLSELASILAKGFLRLISSQKELDVPIEDEAPCDLVVNSQKNRTSMEGIA
jgi:hypothetical protein